MKKSNKEYKYPKENEIKEKKKKNIKREIGKNI